MWIHILEESKGKEEGRKKDKQRLPVCKLLLGGSSLCPAPLWRGAAPRALLPVRLFPRGLVYPALELNAMLVVVSDLYLCILRVIILKQFASI